MEQWVVYFLYLLPFLLLPVLYIVLARWGRKHDSLSGHARNLWRTNGGTSRHRDERN